MSSKLPGCCMWSREREEIETRMLKEGFGPSLNSYFENADTPKKVIDQICLRIASEFSRDGFMFRKGDRSLAKKVGETTLQISFATTRHNLRGRFAFLLPHAGVRSAKLKAWRNLQDAPFRDEDWVAGGMIHRLLSEEEYQKVEPVCQWNFAVERLREETTLDLISFIRFYVVRYFEYFSSAENAISHLLTHPRNSRSPVSIPAFEIEDSVEYVLCFGSKQQASDLINKVSMDFVRYSNFAELPDEVDAALRHMRQHGIESHFATRTAWARTIARLKFTYDI